MIEPLEVVIAYLRADTTVSGLVGNRVAAKHRYGTDWTRSQASIVVSWDGGEPNKYVPVQPGRFEVRCYAPSVYKSLEVWRALVAVSRATNREPVTVTGGTALLYWLHLGSQPAQLYDDAVEMDFVLCFLEALVSENAMGD